MERSIKVTQAMIDRYGQINGDNDILHYDHDYAVKRGFRGTLAHGLMMLGYAVELATRKWGKDWHYRGEIDVRFVGPVIPGDEVRVNIGDDGTVTATIPSGETMKGTIGLR
jgi:3-hydroxybutyryl-CoA dehydratase